MKLLILSIIIFLFGLLNIFNPIRNILQRSMAPFQYGTLTLARGIKDGFGYFVNLENIYNENVFLMKEVNELKSQLVELEDLKAENEVLREQLELTEGVNVVGNVVLASVLGNPLDSSGTSLILDRGSKNGIEEEDMVVKGRIFVGRIISVTDRRSVVELTTSPNLTATVVDINTKTEAIVIGQYGTSIKMHRILPQESITNGDIVVTSGRDGKYLPGFIVGEVDSIVEESASSLKSATLKTMFDFSSIDRVFVIISR